MSQSQLTRKIVTTSDGSSSIFVEELKEHYHSTHGAIQEAEHVFLKMGLTHVLKSFSATDQIEILEVGFGTGLNCLLTELTNCQVNYHGLEAYPINSALISELNYADLLPESSSKLSLIHKAEWQQYVEIRPGFSLCKDQVLLENVLLEQKYHLVYFDAFGPKVQEELWTVKLFTKLYQAMVSGGVFVTYCAKGQVRRDLESVGFKIERLPGPPGKREMLRGTKA